MNTKQWKYLRKKEKMRKAQIGNIYKASIVGTYSPNYHIQREKAMRDGVRKDVFEAWVRFVERHPEKRGVVS